MHIIIPTLQRQYKGGERSCNSHKAQVPVLNRAWVTIPLITSSIPEAGPHCLKFLVVFAFSKCDVCLLRLGHLCETGRERNYYSDRSDGEAAARVMGRGCKQRCWQSEVKNTDFPKDSQSNSCTLFIATIFLLSWQKKTALMAFGKWEIWGKSVLNASSNC